MWDLPDLSPLAGIGTPETASYHSPFDHGLGRDRDRFAVIRARTSIGLGPRAIEFGITQLHPVNLTSEESVARAIELLERHVTSWQDRVSYHALGAHWHGVPDDTAATSGENDSAPISAAKSADKRFVMHPHHYGYLRLYGVFEKAFASAAGENADPETLHAAELAERALRELLPPQAYLFISPTDLMQASKEATRIAEETIKHARDHEKEAPKSARLYGRIKNKLAHDIRALRVRHDGRMHIFPYTALSAPDTGVATIAIIASQQQSIVGDHGRYGASARGLVF